MFNPDRDAYTQLGKYLSERHSDQLSTQLAVYQSALINFAREHGQQIQANPEFREKFTEMCQSIGLDPLELSLYSLSKSASKKERSDNFYVGLGVKIVEVCQQTRDLNGGLISFKELVPQLQNNVNLQTAIDEEDVLKSLAILKTLGDGYEILTINDKKWLKFCSSTDANITSDQKRIYEVCTFMGGYVTQRLLRDNYGWDKIRCKTVIDEMIMNGFLWVDTQGPGGQTLYWVPSWLSD